MKKHSDTFEVKISPRETESIALDIPKKTLASIQKFAEEKGMSPQALLKFYIGQGLRQDVTIAFSNRVVEKTAHVLAQHVSEDEVMVIMQEIQMEASL